MSQVPSAPADAAQPAQYAPAAPYSAPAPAPAQPPQPAYQPAAAPAQTPQDQFVQVDRGRLAPWNGDYHTALRDAHTGRQYGSALELARQYNVAPETLQVLLQEFTSQAAPQGQPQYPYPPVQNGLTKEEVADLLQQQLRQHTEQLATQFGGLVDQRLSAVLQQHTQTNEQRQRLQEQVHDSMRLRKDAEQKFLGELKLTLTNEDGSVNRRGRNAQRELHDAIFDAMEARMPDALRQLDAQAKANPEDAALQRQAEAAMNHFYATPTRADLDAANKASIWMKDQKYEHAAAVAHEQEAVPDATGGDGTPGTPSAQDYDSLTREQKIDAVMGSVSDDELE